MSYMLIAFMSLAKTCTQHANSDINSTHTVLPIPGPHAHYVGYVVELA